MRSRSSSSASESSLPEEQLIQIFVKISGGQTLPLRLSPSEAISNLISLLSSQTSQSPESLRLLYAGRHLSPAPSETTISSSQILNNSTLYLLGPVRGGMAPPKKPRCSFKDCKEQAQRIVGDCGFCNGHFCGKHRMLESHACSGLEDCKKESHERNADKLNSERTTVIRGI